MLAKHGEISIIGTKYLHIMNNANYIAVVSFVKFLKKYFNKELHRVLLIDKLCNVPREIQDFSFIKVLDRESRDYKEIFFDYISSTDVVIVHSLVFTFKEQFEILLKPRVLNKLVWVSWGADLYQWKREIINPIFLIRNFVGYIFRRNIKYFVGIFPPDIDYFKCNYPSKAKTFYAYYIGETNDELVHSSIAKTLAKRKSRSNSTVNILIGHQCNPVLKHIEVLEALSRFSENDIKIYIPLNYGDMKYGDYVQAVAEKIFGKKLVCIREKMSKEKYLDLLSNIDISIFNTMRQIGLGNIMPLLYFGKKIYMPSDSVMFRYYMSIGIKINEYESIKCSDFGQFICPVDMSNGKNYILANNSSEQNNMWKSVFKYFGKVVIGVNKI